MSDALMLDLAQRMGEHNREIGLTLNRDTTIRVQVDLNFVIDLGFDSGAEVTLDRLQECVQGHICKFLNENHIREYDPVLHIDSLSYDDL